MQITVPHEVALRLTRADQELAALQTTVRNYLMKVPYSPGFEADPKRPDRRRVFVKIKEQLPDEIPIQLSECIHHWRASLDNFAYMISRRHSGHTGGSEFPIFLDPAVYAERQKNGTPTRRSGLHKITGMKPAAQAAIERLQPFNRGKTSDPLWMLHELSNTDKHRLVHTYGSALGEFTYSVAHVDSGAVVKTIRALLGPVEDNATIGYIDVEKTADPDAKITGASDLSPHGHAGHPRGMKCW
jgi:hypothetical protein